MNNKEYSNILILGAGLSGLTTAYLLAKQGYSVTILEKEEKCGGLCKSIFFKDIISDIGPHQICSEEDLVINFVKDILGDDLLIKSRKVSQYVFGKYIGYPLKIKDFLFNINIFLTLKICFEVLIVQLKSFFVHKKEDSFKDWVNNRFGKTAYEIYFGPYTEKVWGISPDELDPRTASARIAFKSVFDYLIKSLLFCFRKKCDYVRAHSPLKNKFYYSKLGIETLINKLQDKCLSLGVNIINNANIVKIDTLNNDILSIGTSDGKKYRNFDLYISTLPITLIANLFNPNFIDKMPLEFRAILIIVLKINRELEDPYTWIYYPDTDICFQRITDYNNFDKNMSKLGFTSLSAEISCDVEDEIWKMKDEDIIFKTKEDLVSSGFINYSDNVEAVVHRERYAYPIQVNGYIELTAKLLNELSMYSGFISTGRQGLYKYCDMDEVIEMSYDLVEQINKEEFVYNLSCNFRGVGV